MPEPRPYSDQTRRFSRLWWMGGLRDAMWALLVAALIWIFADMQHTETQDVSVTIVLSSSDPDKRIVSPETHKISFTLAGVRKELETFRRRFNNKTLPKYDVGDLTTDRAHAIPTLTILRTVPELEQSGLSVQSISPSTLTGVKLAAVETHTLPIEFVPVGHSLAIPAVVTPDKAAIRVTADAWKQLTSRPTFKPVIRTQPTDLTNYSAGQTVEKPVKLQARLDGMVIELADPDREYKVKFTVGQPMAEKTVTVNVAIHSPATWSHDGTWGQYVLKRNPSEADNWKITLTVTGSKTDVGRATEKDIVAYVILEDRHKELTRSWDTEPVQVQFINDLQLRLKTGSRPTISFRLEKKPKSSGNP